MKRTTVTLKDVAREAGFSVMTVSHVLNGKKLNHASPQSRELILATAKRLNYRPNLNARQLVTKRSNRIGLLIDSTSPQFYRDVMLALEPLAFERNYRLQVGFVHSSRFESLQQYIADFRGSGIDSVICLAHAYPEFGDRVPALLAEFENVVYMEKPLAPTRFPVVVTDHYRNFHDAVAELLRRGHRRVFSIRSNYRDHAWHEARRGMVDAYLEAGVKFEEAFWWEGVDWWRDLETAEKEIRRLMPGKPDALIVGNDESMFQALRALRAQGRRAPEDVSLFSAELGNFGRAAMPSFSGFDYHAPVLAEKIMKMLGQSIAGEISDAGETYQVPARIVWGESCRERR